MTRKRLKGAVLTLKVGTPAVEYQTDVTAATITNEEAADDTTTFSDVAAGGGRDFFLNITAVQSTDPDSLWSEIWDSAGETVTVTLAPHGNAVATAAEPHFIMDEVKIGPAPELGGEASIDGTWTFESQWRIVSGKPVKDIGA